MERQIQHIQTTVKHAADVGGVGAVVVAWVDVINPLLETGILLLTAAWFIYRIREARANIKLANDQEKENG